MSDEALAWKITFGALVLVFCAVSYWTREPARPAQVNAAAPAATAAPAPPVAPAPAPLPAASAPPLPEAAPPDIPDVQEARDEMPVGIHLPPPKQARHHAKSNRRVPSTRVHLVRHRTTASPYAKGRKHYPFDPLERWRDRYA